MGLDFMNLFNQDKPELPAMAPKLSKDEAAAMLKTNPDALKAFEEAYAMRSIADGDEGQLGPSSRQASARQHVVPETEKISEDAVAISQAMQDTIVEELLAETEVYIFDGDLSNQKFEKPFPALPDGTKAITNKDIQKLPIPLRPQLTGSAAIRDMGGESSYESLLYFYSIAHDQSKSEEDRRFAYNHFRQGLDILDLDPIVYQMLGMNPNSMSHWLPALVTACRGQDFFKIPATRIAKVPMTLLQMSRLDYGTMTPATLAIVDKWAMKAFALNTEQDYFIKTGTYSSKFDFRNAHVTAGKEVTELGEYLLFIHFQGNQMASPLSSPVIYGASTTNEWVVREFIKDKENNPCIYKGLPLHTEYRVFVDCDTDTVLGWNPYWDPEVMLKRFGHSSDSDSPHQIHDYVVYKAHEEVLMRRYHENIDRVISHIKDILPALDLKGQWSIDVMQNSDDFYLIDMATAETSAYREVIPKELRRPQEENWLPSIPSA